MKSFNRLLAFFVVLLLTVGLVTGCGGGTPAESDKNSNDVDTSSPANKEDDSDEKEQTTEDIEPFKEHIKISIAHWDIDKSLPPGAEDPVYDKVKQDLNIDIEPVAVSWGDFRDKINVWAASGELPDVFSIDVVGTTTYMNWIKNNIIRALPDDLSKYPKVKSVVEKDDVAAYKVDGKNWFIPRPNYPDPNWWANDRGAIVRKDWMEKLNIEDPKTDDEFIDMCVAFATRDPDGNGKADTVGLTTISPDFIWGAVSHIAPNLAWGGWVKEDGQWVRVELSQQAFNFYKFVKKLYKAGGLDKDFAVQSEEDAINKMGSGKAGILTIQVAAKHINKVYNVWNKLFQDKKFTDSFKILYERPDANGERWRFITASFWSESYINAKVDDNKMDRILALYDYLMQDQTQKMLLYGIENVDYRQKDDGSIENLLGKKEDGTEITAAEKYPFLYSMSYLATWGDEYQYDNPAIPEDIRKMSREHLEWSLQNCKAPVIYWALLGLQTPTKEKVAFNVAEDMINFVLSDKSDEEAWQDIVAKYEAQGYKQLVEEITTAAEELGIQ